MDRNPSFMTLLELYRELDEIFFRHQEALLVGEMDRAIFELQAYQRKL
jgi:hypothetical protein